MCRAAQAARLLQLKGNLLLNVERTGGGGDSGRLKSTEAGLLKKMKVMKRWVAMVPKRPWKQAPQPPPSRVSHLA